jgi:gamma-glutamylcyclotransferase
MNSLYFAYGANMHPGHMSWRCPGAQAQGAFVLRDWELKFYSHATIEPRPGATVAGVLWEITEACEQSLDAFEGFPHYYTKRTWRQDGVQFMFYEMNSPKSGRPSEGYVLDIAESYSFWQLPQALLNESLHDTA